MGQPSSNQNSLYYYILSQNYIFSSKFSKIPLFFTIFQKLGKPGPNTLLQYYLKPKENPFSTPNPLIYRITAFLVPVPYRQTFLILSPYIFFTSPLLLASRTTRLFVKTNRATTRNHDTTSRANSNLLSIPIPFTYSQIYSGTRTRITTKPKSGTSLSASTNNPFIPNPHCYFCNYPNITPLISHADTFFSLTQ